jgi:hypothetical protein
MKTLILTCLGGAAVLSFTACTTVEEVHTPAVRSTTTTTEETTTRRPMEGTTTETQTIRRY